MSELTDVRTAGSDLHWRLLSSVSAFALLATICASQAAADADADHPTVWIELGGLSERQTGQSSTFIPSFIANDPEAPAFQGFDLQAQKAPLFTNGLEGKLTFEPEGTDWVLSAAILYGRASGSKNINHLTAGHRVFHDKTVFKTYMTTPSGYRSKHFHCCVTHTNTTGTPAFANMQARSRQSHKIVDFQAGRDVGVGLFGEKGSSVVSAGVRFVQFISKSNAVIHALPSISFQKHVLKTVGYTVTRYYELPRHPYSASASTARSFHGIGPAISWNGSAPVLGNGASGEISFDWGANAAVLFGRQKAAGKHHTYGIYHASQPSIATLYNHTASFNRQRAVVVPNVGGLVGVSFRYANAKVSFGYRGDFFFGAMDGGIDASKKENVGFYGPFATVSVGLGG